jgi:hypothetical protein
MKKLQNLGRALSKQEQKRIMGGDYADPKCSGSCDYEWTDYNGKKHTTTGTCKTTDRGTCYCSNGVGSCS